MTRELYYRHLPHWQPLNSFFFVTFRLAHSLPQAVLDEMHREREREEKEIRAQWSGESQSSALYRLNKKYFGKYDAWLDQCLSESPHWLAEEQVARIVMDTIHRQDGDHFALSAFCIMPNHVHLLIDTTGFSQVTRTNQAGTTKAYPLTDCLRLLKGGSARYCNQKLGRSGAFWHHESYEHVVRDEGEYERILRYIRQNPVKAGLVADWQQWPFTYSVGRD